MRLVYRVVEYLYFYPYFESISYLIQLYNYAKLLLLLGFDASSSAIFKACFIYATTYSILRYFTAKTSFYPLSFVLSTSLRLLFILQTLQLHIIKRINLLSFCKQKEYISSSSAQSIQQAKSSISRNVTSIVLIVSAVRY